MSPPSRLIPGRPDVALSRAHAPAASAHGLAASARSACSTVRARFVARARISRDAARARSHLRRPGGTTRSPPADARSSLTVDRCSSRVQRRGRRAFVQRPLRTAPGRGRGRWMSPDAALGLGRSWWSSRSASGQAALPRGPRPGACHAAGRSSLVGAVAMAVSSLSTGSKPSCCRPAALNPLTTR